VKYEKFLCYKKQDGLLFILNYHDYYIIILIGKLVCTPITQTSRALTLLLVSRFCGVHNGGGDPGCGVNGPRLPGVQGPAPVGVISDPIQPRILPTSIPMGSRSPGFRLQETPSVTRAGSHE